MAEFAIIASYDNGETSVHYYKGTKNGAIEEAEDTKLMTGAWCVTIARVCAFVGMDDQVSEY